MDKSNERQNSDTSPLVERREFLGGAATLAGTSLLGLAVPVPPAVTDLAPDRMPPILPDKMTEAQKKAVDEVVNSPRKSFVGPFIPLLRSPEFMSRLQKAGAYLRYETKLGTNISEFIILITARQWTQQFEWDSHQDSAKQAGIKPDIVAAIAEGRRPTGMSPDQEMIHDFCSELCMNRSVSDSTYAQVVKRFGEQGVIDITGLCGYYSMLGMIMNVARTPIPGAKTLPLDFFPH